MNNIVKIKSEISSSEFDGLLLTSQENRYYATGYDSTDGYILISENEAALFIDARYSEEAAEKITDVDVINIDNAADAYKKMNSFLERNGVKYLGIEGGKMSNSTYLRLKEKLTPDFSNCQQILSSLRSVKSDEELEIMKKAQSIAEKSLLDTLPFIKSGITEKELAGELFCRMIKNGADDRSFETIVVSGTHTSMPHGKAEDRMLQPGFLTIDYGCKYKGYCSDTTRTFCLGEPTEAMVKVYDTVLKAQNAALSAAKGGMTGKALDNVARRVITEAGYGAYFVHALSHGLGIEIHEQPNASPLSQDVLPIGTVISVEPGIYIPGKFGVRIEDVIALKDNGCENLTSLPKDLSVICI